MLEGVRVRDLQRLAPDVLAGVLPRLYPQMLEIAYEHQDAGRPIFICTAASQEMAELMAIVLTFDGAVGSVSEVVDGHYTGREGGPFTYREGKAEAIRDLARARGHRPRRVVGLLGLGVRPADAAARRPPRRGQPGRRARPHRARARAGRCCASSASAGGCACSAPRASPPRSAGSARSCSRAARRRRGGAQRDPAAPAMSLHELTDEQREIRDLAARFADERIAPHAAAWDRDAHVPAGAVRRARASSGLMGVCVPEEHGGAGADFLSYVLVLEELSRADAGVGVTVAVHTSACTLPLLAHGGERCVPALASGAELGAFALTEPGSGSDAGAMRTPRAGRPDHRHEAVDHQRLARRDVHRLRPRGATPAPARSSCAPARPASRSRARRRSWA